MGQVASGLLPWHLDRMTSREVLQVIFALADAHTPS